MEAVHTSVMLQETLSMLEPENANSFLIDCTMGEGGHSFGFLTKYPNVRVLGLDADVGIQARAKERLASFGNRVSFCHTWFDDFFFSYPHDLVRPDLILFDLGISVYHYQLSGRGFTFREEEPLDMRLDSSSGETAADIVNKTEENDLADLIYKYGEERYSRRIARRICEVRKNSSITTAKQLADIIYDAVPGDYRHGRLHPATRTFQALRISVNGELNRLERVLDSAYKVLAENGKMAVITFHSLEDRIVKNFFREKAKRCICPKEQMICSCGGKAGGELLNHKAIEAKPEEVATNAPSRSARLRGIRKIYDRESV